MSRTLTVLILGALMTAAAWAGGDRIKLKDGLYVYGDILFFNEGVITIATGKGTERIPIADIEKIEFGPGTKLQGNE